MCTRHRYALNPVEEPTIALEIVRTGGCGIRRLDKGASPSQWALHLCNLFGHPNPDRESCGKLYIDDTGIQLKNTHCPDGWRCHFDLMIRQARLCSQDSAQPFSLSPYQLSPFSMTPCLYLCLSCAFCQSPRTTEQAYRKQTKEKSPTGGRLCSHPNVTTPLKLWILASDS